MRHQLLPTDSAIHLDAMPNNILEPATAQTMLGFLQQPGSHEEFQFVG